METAPTPLRDTDAVTQYRMHPSTPLPGQKRSTRGLKLPPLVVPEEQPSATMCRILQCNEWELEENADYKLLRNTLIAYAKAGDERNWDQFRAKLKNQEILPIWAMILSECARNGYVGPYAHDGKIRWRQVITAGEFNRLDLCVMCERLCDAREEIDTGRAKWRRQHDANYREPKRCWP